MDFFGIGPLELLVIVVVALLVLGPDHLPKLANRLGVMLSQARKSVAEAREAVVGEIEDKTKAAREPIAEDAPPAAKGKPS